MGGRGRTDACLRVRRWSPVLVATLALVTLGACTATPPTSTFRRLTSPTLFSASCDPLARQLTLPVAPVFVGRHGYRDRYGAPRAISALQILSPLAAARRSVPADLEAAGFREIRRAGDTVWYDAPRDDAGRQVRVAVTVTALADRPAGAVVTGRLLVDAPFDYGPRPPGCWGQP